MKNKAINKTLLTAYNPVLKNDYYNFSMQILNCCKQDVCNIFAISSDTNKLNTRDIVCLNVCSDLASKGKKVLLINLGYQDSKMQELFEGETKLNEVIKYDNFDILLNYSNEFKCDTKEDLVEYFGEYDIVIFSVPPVNKYSQYLALPSQVSYFMLINKFCSSYYALNKCIKILNEKEICVLGSVFVKIK